MLPIPGGRVVEAAVLANGEIQRPQKVFFENFERQPSTKVAIRSTALEDLYVVLAGWEGSGPDARVSLSVFVNPLVAWIWFGGFVFLVGTVVAMWPAPQPAARTVPARLEGRTVGATA
jgi:cytochrome c-type biogenesis protein CcmF